MTTPLQCALQLRASKWGGIVKFSWSEGEDHCVPTSHCVLDLGWAFGNRKPCVGGRGQSGCRVEGTRRSQRNCRCGDMGGKAVVSHLKKEVKERGASAGRVRIGQIRCEHFSFSARRLVRTGKTCPPNLLTVVLAIPRRPLTLSAPTLLKDPLRVGEEGAGCVL